MPSDGFELVDELALAVDPQQWVLVGGLMVHAHSQLADLPNPRPTTDADAVLEMASTLTYSAAAAQILELGFTHYESLDHRAPAYRFERGADRIDLMAPDRGTAMRFASRDVLQVPASASALKNTETFTTAAATTVRIPNLAGALALKGAACETLSPNPIRHAQDGVVLFACAQKRDARHLQFTTRRDQQVTSPPRQHRGLVSDRPFHEAAGRLGGTIRASGLVSATDGAPTRLIRAPAAA